MKTEIQTSAKSWAVQKEEDRNYVVFAPSRQNKESLQGLASKLYKKPCIVVDIKEAFQYADTGNFGYTRIRTHVRVKLSVAGERVPRYIRLTPNYPIHF